jgi:para-nitrobenzyl esterase
MFAPHLLRSPGTLAVALLCLGSVACGDPARPQAYLDAASVVPPEAALDATRDATPTDATSEPTLDAASLDASSDAAAADAGPSDTGQSDSGDAAPDAGKLTLQLRGGTLQGKLEDRSRVFLGIPYAKPPLGPLRFAPPEPAPAWQGTRMAIAYGPSCPQPAGGVKGALDEDCLTLNVTTPLDPPAGGAPVMVFFHGGGFGTGGGAGYPAQWLSEPAGTLIVTLNYRLGALGFLAHPELDAVLSVPSGNMGLRDQQLALRWVQENIAVFGGNPDKVTVFGESAGALSACLHMFARGSESLAHAFIMESGSCIMGSLKPKTRAQALEDGSAYANQRCVLAADVVACLRELPVESFVATDFTGAAGGGSGAGWPNADGTLLPDSLTAEISTGRFNPGPLIIGSNEREAALYRLYGFPGAQTKLDMMLLLLGLYPDHWQAIYQHYEPSDDRAAGEAFIRAQTDEQFRCPGRALARLASKQGRKAYLYNFAVTPAAHSQELDYVFGWPSGGVSEQFPGEAPNPATPQVVKGMQGYWTTFARTGDPNDGAQLVWPAYRADADQSLRIAQPFALETHLAQADCDFWDALYGVAP